MKNRKLIKSTIFLLSTLLSIGIFTGCDKNSPVGVNGSGDNNTVGGNNTDSENGTSGDDNIAGDNGNGGDNNSGDAETVPVAQQKGWYIRLTVQSDTLEDKSTVFGYLEGASDTKDRYDSEALSSTGLYTTVYHTDFGSIKNYKSDYRAYKAAGEGSDIWIIKVNSGDTAADVTLSWDGITYVTKNPKGGFQEEHKVESTELSQMRLVDVDNGTVIYVEENDMQITFNMNGSKERTFKWILLKDGETEPEAVATVASSHSVKSASVQNFKVEKIKEERSDEFAPPSFEKR